MAWAIGSILGVALVLCSLGSTAVAQSLFTATQDPLAGSRVFGQNGCIGCHAVNGSGGHVGPDLARVPRPRSFYDLAAAMWNHIPRMSERMRELGIPRPRLDGLQTGNLIAFLYTLNYFDRAGDTDAGRRLFSAKRCIACHQVEGRGGVIGPPLEGLARYGSPILVAAALWNHGPAMSEAMRERQIERPSFKGTELVDLIEYLKSSAGGAPAEPLYVLPGSPERGRTLFTDKRCTECHSVSGQGGREGPDLAERGLQASLTEFAAAMWNKAPAMTAAMKARGISVPQLRAEEMADIVAYLYAVRYFADRGDPARGRRLAASKGCLACHGHSGEHDKVGPDLSTVVGLDSPATVISALWNHGPAMSEAMRQRRIEPWPQFRPEEMADLVAYLQSMRLAKPGGAQRPGMRP